MNELLTNPDRAFARATRLERSNVRTDSIAASMELLVSLVDKEAPVESPSKRIDFRI